MNGPRFAIAGGGTGGHVTMALALGEAFRERGLSPLFIGAERGFEARWVPDAGFELVTLPAQPVAGRSWWGRARGAVALLRCTVAALRTLRATAASGVISVGGYAAAPATFAAVLARRPLFLVEPNAVPGRTNRIVARFASRIFAAFPTAAEGFGAAVTQRVEAVGAPLRNELLDAFARAPARQRPEPPLRLLVLGGSQGARQLNDAMIDAVPHLEANHFEVMHQSGPADRERVAEAYAQAGVAARVVDFETHLAPHYLWADLALCRAGALTVAELAVAGLPALLVPYPYAADDHQRANAQQLERAGAAHILEAADLGAKALAERLIAYAHQPGELVRMGSAARGCGRPDAARRIVAACLEWFDPTDAADATGSVGDS